MYIWNIFLPQKYVGLGITIVVIVDTATAAIVVVINVVVIVDDNNNNNITTKLLTPWKLKQNGKKLTARTIFIDIDKSRDSIVFNIIARFAEIWLDP